MIQPTSTNCLHQLQTIITVLTPKQYAMPLSVLNNSSIGMHVRHILEFYQCLISGLETGIVNYDKRKRSLELETQPNFSLQLIHEIKQFLESCTANISLELEASYALTENENPIKTPTNLYRELMYNIEHTVHHLAIIKIGFKTLDCQVEIDENIGVASSTIRKNICAQ
ncbi:DinB family protein [Joostella sp. CR20]|uniref:DinB family protein n=1 Tax=Joostella sp. CR20 TaxID=2804312 RepID=UPI00313C30E3